MEIGELVAGRFRLEQHVGSGGMGTVYRAIDETTRQPVALKLLHEDVPEGIERFHREIAALARMSHPAIVRYVAHGDSPPFVAMEWLDGEDLARRLRTGPLSVGESIELGVRLADALEHAHGHGIVHRDIKPGNLLFENGDPSRVRIVDFGLAWITGDVGFRTRAGMMLGTPGYMAPEQARGEVVDARTDVFAIGCVLYKCLTGRGPFSGGDAVATLAKMLFEEPEPASTLRPGVPRALDGVLARAMAKERAKRPATARELSDELRRIASAAPAEESGAFVPAPPSSTVLTDRERRIVSVVVAARESVGGAGDEISTIHVELDSVFAQRESTLQEIAHRHGAQLEVLPVAMVAVLSGRGGASDRAAAAARLSLALRDALGDVPIALATGRAEIGGRAVGEVIDRAVARVAAKGAERAVWLDETTAGLLGPTFEVRAASAGLELVRERPTDMHVRTLLGKPTPCVGRDREIAFLDATLAECESDEVARAVIVTAPAGVGKSRLRYEWLRKLADRGLEVWSARADAMTAGAPFSLAGQLVRRAAGIDPGEPLDAARARLRARISRHVRAEADVRRIAEFLGEIVGARFDDEGRVQLRAARQDPLLMGDQIRRAFEDWVGAEAAAAPLVIVLEDIHWGDLPTVQLVDWALGAHAGLPLMVLALARPEVKETFPNLWQARNPLDLPLGELTPKAGARLARHVLGPDVSQDTIDRIVARAAGNAFFLEEILRAVAEGRGDEMPETVLAMVQRRLEALAPDARRVLRAASVFGETFWRGAVLAHVGAASNPISRVDDWLRDLVSRELVTERKTSRFAGEQELVFRHALLREAAYAMLTDDDRALAHRLAGAWLEERGERDAAVLAEHFDRGGEPSRAVSHYAVAAAQALEGSDLSRVLALAERGVALGAAGTVLGELHRLRAEALRWRGRISDCESCAREAVALLEPGTPSWHTAVGELVTAAGALAHLDVLVAARADLLARGRHTEQEFAIALARTVMQLYASGQRDVADEALASLERLDASTFDPVARARIEQARAMRALYSSDHGTYYEGMKKVRALFELAGDRRNACVQAANMGYVAVVFGVFDEAEETLTSMMPIATVLGIVRIRAIFQQNMGLLRHMQGKHVEAIAFERQSAATFEAQGDMRLQTFSLIYMSMAMDANGDTADAFATATRAVAVSEPLLPAHASALANLADLELRRGELESALAHALEAHDLLEKLGGIEDTESLVRVVCAEALAAARRNDEAREVVRKALASIETRSSMIQSASFREAFRRTAENVRTFALAQKLRANSKDHLN